MYTIKLPQIISSSPAALALLFVNLLSPALGQIQSPAAPPPTPPATKEEKAVVLDPFIVSTKQDKGYYSEQTLSGARYNKNIHDIPTSITIINKEYLADLAAYDMLEPIKYAVSGVTLNQPDADDWNIRGFRTRGGFRNGMSSAFGGYQSSTWDVERLEILKGPASMLTGVNSSAIGGTVNYISAKPTETFNSWISTTLAEYDEWRVHAQSSGPLWRQSGDTKVLYRVTGGLWDRKFVQPLFYHKENFVGGAIRAITGKATTVTLEYSHLDKDSSYYDSDLTDPVAYDAGLYQLRTDYRNFSGTGPESRLNLNNTIIEAEVLHTFTKYFSTRFKYQWTEENQDINSIFVTDYAPGSTLIVNRGATESRLTGRTSQYQLDVLGHLNTGPFKHEFLVGLDYSDGNTQQRWFDTYAMPSVDIRNPNFSQDKATQDTRHANGLFPYVSEINRRVSTTYSYYYQENLSFWKDRITVIGGWRTLDSWYSTQTYTPKNFTEVNAIPLGVYKHGLIIKPMRNVSLYATKGKNFFPSSGQTANPGTPFSYVFPDSNGEILEFGVKFMFMNGKIYGSFANFDLARTNVRSSRIVTFPDGSIRTIEAHLDTTTKGWEFDLGSRFKVPFGTVDLIATTYDAISLTPNNVAAYNAPTYITSGTGKITIAQGPLKGFTFGAAMRNESRVNYSATRFNHRPAVASVFVGYRYSEHISANLNVDNATDEQYFITAGRADGEAALGRKIRLTMKYTF